MRAYERFLNYVKIHTTSDPISTTVPTTMRQLNLAKMLAEELSSLSVNPVALTENGYVYAKIPASVGCENAPAIGFVAHMDTAPSFNGENVTPILHKNYDGGDITLPKGNCVIKAESFGFLKDMVGKTVITADGSTLLGADDKAGIAEIITMCEHIITENIPHGAICIGFTPDEEVGAGADGFDIEKFGAKYAYTVDGDLAGTIEYENFNAADAVVKIDGVSVHPGSAKDVMVNAMLLAMEVHALLPSEAVPEKTSGYEGFFFLEKISGDNAFAKMHYIIRDHDLQKFNDKKLIMQNAVEKVSQKHKTAKLKLEITDSYFNMKQQIEPCMHLVEIAKNSICEAGLTPKEKPIRGGTDGSRLSYMGLPCPNLGTGGENFHGPYELITIEDMDKSVEILINITKAYSRLSSL